MRNKRYIGLIGIFLAAVLCWGGAVLAGEFNPFEEEVKVKKVEKTLDALLVDPFDLDVEDNFNGRYLGKTVDLCLKPEGESFVGTLKFHGETYSVEAQKGQGGLIGTVGPVERHITFNLKKQGNVYLIQIDEFKDILIEQTFPELDETHQGEKGTKVIFSFRKSGEYAGTLEYKGKGMPFTGKLAGGALEGKMKLSLTSTNEIPFTVKAEDDALTFQTGGFEDRLNMPVVSKLLESAHNAEWREDWEQVQTETEKILRIEKNNVEAKRLFDKSQMVKLLRKARQAKKDKNWDQLEKYANSILAIAVTPEQVEAQKLLALVKEEMGKAKNLLGEANAAKGNEDWTLVKEKAEQVLEIIPNQPEARELIELSLQEMIGKYLADAQNAKEKKDWATLKSDAEAILALKKDHSEAISLRDEAQIEMDKQVMLEKIEKYLEEARIAKYEKDWTTLKSKAEAILALEAGHSEASQLKELAIAELMPKEGEPIVVQFDKGVTLEMVWIKPGNFKMGSSKRERGREKTEIQHEVTLTKGYWIGIYEVTQAQYKFVMNTNPSKFQGGDLPVECVSWNEAMEFCRKLTEQERTAGRLPLGYAYTLPTEAQWEYACRAETTTALNSGMKLRSEAGVCSNLDKVGWYDKNSDGKTHLVGQKQPNNWGLYDMHGNVWEWCLDWYEDYSTSSVTDSTGSDTGSTRVNRGGSWSSSAKFCRSANRGSCTPDFRCDLIGFRVVISPAQ